MIKVLIVDDSAFMRNILSGMISSDPEIKVVGIARDGIEAVEKVAILKPDIVTMDVDMPRMDGIEALRQIMAKNPVPVLMVSSLTTEGAKETLDAFDIGAVDFIPKNLAELSLNIVRIKDILIEKIKQIGKKKLILKKRRPLKPLEIPRAIKYSKRRIGVVAVGTSTGGPNALQNIISRFPGDFPVPIVIAQHMPPNFTRLFAERLNQLSLIGVKEAEEGEPLRKGIAYVAPGRGHMSVTRKTLTEHIITISEDEGDFIYRPSVDVLMLSVVKNFSGQTLGVILTGMGNDGEKGMEAIKKAGGRTIAQDEETCIIYGMPSAVVNAGFADRVVPLDEIAGEIINLV